MRLKENISIGDRRWEKYTIKMIRKMKEYCSKKNITEERDLGKKEKRILDPSSGGMGTRLKIANAKFIITI